MIRWGFLKQFPKFVVVSGTIALSTAAFFIWRVTYSARHFSTSAAGPQVIEDKLAKTARIKSDPFALLLVDNDLYDLGSGELVLRSWLKQGMPLRIFWHERAQKFLAQYQQGFIRYNLDGSIDKELGDLPSECVSDDLKWAVYSKDQNVHKADIDWESLSLVNEHKITNTGQFNDQYFPSNLFIGTEKTLIARNANKLVNIAIQSGEVKSMDMSLDKIVKRRSPDNRHVVGTERGQFYCYEVDTDKADMHPLGRRAVNDYQWLGNGKCVAILAMRGLVVYETGTKSLSDLVELPSPCNQVGGPSPDLRFLFCWGNGAGFLVDTVNKSVMPFAGGAGIAWLSADTFAFARDVQDSSLRGSWVQTVGTAARRFCSEPYVVSVRGAGSIMPMPAGDVVVLATAHGLWKGRLSSGEATEFVKTRYSPKQAISIADWQQRPGQDLVR